MPNPQFDPQVKISLIDLAWEIVNTQGEGDLPLDQEAKIRELAKRFAQAYKAIAETVTSE